MTWGKQRDIDPADKTYTQYALERVALLMATVLNSKVAITQLDSDEPNLRGYYVGLTVENKFIPIARILPFRDLKKLRLVDSNPFTQAMHGGDELTRAVNNIRQMSEREQIEFLHYTPPRPDLFGDSEES